MFCEKCNKNPATFHYTEVVNGVKSEHHLCSECAANTDVSFYSSIFENDEQFTRLLSGLFGSQGILSDSTGEDPANNVQCPNCKMTYGEFIKNSSFGCPTCYDVFGLLIAEKIKKIHGSSVHVGKHPRSYGEQKPSTDDLKVIDNTEDSGKDIEILQKKLKAAVADEDFEEAAKLRDMIADLKKKGGKDA